MKFQIFLAYNSSEQRGKHCSFNQNKKNDEVCAVDIEKAMQSCAPSMQYGYNNNKPCVFLKLNRIFKWTPDVYTSSELPEDMPDDLKEQFHQFNETEV